MPNVNDKKQQQPYPTLAATLCVGDGSLPGTRPALTVEKVKALLGWESESEYTARITAEADAQKKKIKPAAAKFPDGSETLRDARGEKVRCWMCSRNRPFDEAWMQRLAQDRLNGHWHFNGEATIVGKSGQVLSAQHRLISLVIAEQRRQDDPFWAKRWPQPLIYEGVIVVGVDEDLETTNTLDNTKPRTLGDVLYTSDTFRDVESAYDRKKLTRMLDRAVDFLWDRTRAGGEYHRFQTHSESQEFLARHSRLLAAVKHLYTEDSDNLISVNKLSVGQCAAICYLMGSARSDWAEYASLGEAPDEKVLDWSLWDKAKRFWVDLAKGQLGAVTAAIGAAMDDTAKLSVWKQVILAKAWAAYAKGQPVTTDALAVKFNLDESGRRHLDSCEWELRFGGIDQGPRRPKADDELGEDAPVPDEAEIETAKRMVSKRKTVAEMQAEIDARKAAAAATA
jgi:hypothetical protein